MNNVFDYQDYKTYITDRIATYPNNGRGVRRKLADHIGCQNTFITQVLTGNYHFSPEQIEKISSFFLLTPDETEYLLLLLLENRSGTKSLSQFLERSLHEKREKNLSLKNRLKMKEAMDREDLIVYLGDWKYSIIHAAIGVSGLQTSQSIASKLNLEIKTVDKILKFLESRGLVQISDGKYKPSQKMLHFGKDEPLLPNFHRNYRQLASASFDTPKSLDFHYSGVITCSHKESDKIRKKMTTLIEEVSKIIQDSKEEDLMVLNLDWFEV